MSIESISFQASTTQLSHDQSTLTLLIADPFDRDGTTHIILEPLDFIARLAALVPKPRVNLTRFHGVFARGGHPPNSALRKQITPKARCKPTAQSDDLMSPLQRRAAMTWAQRLKRVFNIDIETCQYCSGAVKVIACIEDPAVIKKILEDQKGQCRLNPLVLGIKRVSVD